MLNRRFWPYRYADVRRMADTRIASSPATRPNTGAFHRRRRCRPQDRRSSRCDPLNDDGTRLHAWITFQVLPLVRDRLASGFGRVDRVPLAITPASARRDPTRAAAIAPVRPKCDQLPTQAHVPRARGATTPVVGSIDHSEGGPGGRSRLREDGGARAGAFPGDAAPSGGRCRGSASRPPKGDRPARLTWRRRHGRRASRTPLPHQFSDRDPSARSDRPAIELWTGQRHERARAGPGAGSWCWASAEQHPVLMSRFRRRGRFHLRMDASASATALRVGWLNDRVRARHAAGNSAAQGPSRRGAAVPRGRCRPGHASPDGMLAGHSGGAASAATRAAVHPEPLASGAAPPPVST
jgi:hypothetical protein